MKKTDSHQLAGFTLMDSTIVAVVLAILAVFAVPRFSASVEQSKVADAFTYLSQIESAQQRFHLENGNFSKQLSRLDVAVGKPHDFFVAAPTSLDWKNQWQVRLTRRGQDSSYGEYTVVFDEGGFSPIKSSVPEALLP
jgi:Tfp pilus assembly protein PilE